MLSICCNIAKIKPFTKKYNWKGINNFPSAKDDFKKLDKNNRKIVLNSVYAKKEKIYPVSVSKHNSNREKQVILLITPNGGGWHYLTVKENDQHY